MVLEDNRMVVRSLANGHLPICRPGDMSRYDDQLARLLSTLPFVLLNSTRWGTGLRHRGQLKRTTSTEQAEGRCNEPPGLTNTGSLQSFRIRITCLVDEVWLVKVSESIDPERDAAKLNNPESRLHCDDTYISTIRSGARTNALAEPRHACVLRLILLWKYIFKQ